MTKIKQKNKKTLSGVRRRSTTFSDDIEGRHWTSDDVLGHPMASLRTCYFTTMYLKIKNNFKFYA